MSNEIILLDKNEEKISGSIIKNDVYVYYLKNKNSIYDFKLKKGDQIEVLPNIKEEKWIRIIISHSGNSYFGYILKENIDYKIKKEEITQAKDNNYTVMLVSDNNEFSSITKINTVSIDLMRVVNSNGKIEVNDRDKIIKSAKNNNLKIYACISNGYMASNYDSNILSLLLKSDESRQKLIENIIRVLQIKNINGLIVDFKNLKYTDKEMYTQFVRELNSSIHKEGLVLGVRSNLKNYIDTENILKITDFEILELYNERTKSSNTSGTHSLFSNIQKIIDTYVNSNIQDKIILEVPMYSILWSEKNNVVVDSTIYVNSLAEKYISSNKLKKYIDEKTNQNYIEHTKGSITYKMWLEDEYVLKNKIKLLKQKKLKGISLYKSGYETKKIGEVLNEEF